MPTSEVVKDLAQVASRSALVRAWRGSVRNGLRNQVLPDIHDYLDIHRNIAGIAGRISADVEAGRYRPSPPEFVTIEKKDGISRRVAIPDPTDALLLQCIVNTLETQLKAVQPSKRAYYSRSHTPPNVERVDGTFAYPWWQLWPEFQEKIFQFSTTHAFLVVTDIANYFDTIPLHSLRNVIAAASRIGEHVLDLLFFVLETLTWRPYYIPHSGVGLPPAEFRRSTPARSCLSVRVGH